MQKNLRFSENCNSWIPGFIGVELDNMLPDKPPQLCAQHCGGILNYLDWRRNDTCLDICTSSLFIWFPSGVEVRAVSARCLTSHWIFLFFLISWRNKSHIKMYWCALCVRKRRQDKYEFGFNTFIIVSLLAHELHAYTVFFCVFLRYYYAWLCLGSI